MLEFTQIIMPSLGIARVYQRNYAEPWYFSSLTNQLCQTLVFLEFTQIIMPSLVLLEFTKSSSLVFLEFTQIIMPSLGISRVYPSNYAGLGIARVYPNNYA